MSKGIEKRFTFMVVLTTGIGIFLFASTLFAESIATVAIQSQCGEKRFLNTLGNSGNHVRTFHKHYHHCGEHFDLVLVKEGDYIKKINNEFEKLKKENAIQKSKIDFLENKIRKICFLIGIEDEEME